MKSKLKAIAWDFDGVLNRNVVDGRFVWADMIEEDLGLPSKEFEAGVFDGSFPDVISGKKDLHEHVGAWLTAGGYSHKAQDVLEYWFAKDDLQDPLSGDLLDKLAAEGIVQVIATNNEHYRATYIEETTGFAKRVSHVFSSGRIGFAKPDAAFFHHVTDTLRVAPGEMLLIDDSAVNVRTARSLGWNAFHYTEETRHSLAAYLGY
ncbi:HAD family hydrolase [Roseibium sp. MMSF_3544]|uniref:HAD family hydrolase n=1 Tax=unclassified Roseibium TaxID=2629323 RepID=UPI00273D01E1|nr:HAD-IA family hydrolase [Roseibium sp. MMSF_3544]